MRTFAACALASTDLCVRYRMPLQGHLDIVKVLHLACADLDQETSCAWFSDEVCSTPLHHA